MTFWDGFFWGAVALLGVEIVLITVFMLTTSGRLELSWEEEIKKP